MKILFALSLLSLVAAPKARADSVVEIVGNTLRLISVTQKDIKFLSDNASNCTAYASQIQSKLLDPLSNNIAKYQATLNSSFGNMANQADASDSCRKPTPKEIAAGSASAKIVLASVNDVLVQTATKQSQLYYYTPDQAMAMAFTVTASSRSSWPDCRPDNTKDFSSTPELKAYLSIKHKLSLIKASMIALQAESQALAQNHGEAVCVEAN